MNGFSALGSSYGYIALQDGIHRFKPNPRILLYFGIENLSWPFCIFWDDLIFRQFLSFWYFGILYQVIPGNIILVFLNRVKSGDIILVFLYQAKSGDIILVYCIKLNLNISFGILYRVKSGNPVQVSTWLFTQSHGR
jgi:hypothetical protein